MPYTPPSSRSPAVSIQPSPVNTPKRPQLPRSNSSTSYLSRHRQSSSLPDFQTYHAQPTANGHDGNASSIRRSPPPVTDRIMPAGAIISPPDSAQNSSDEEDSSSWKNNTSQDLEELQDAVRRSFNGKKQPGSPQNETVEGQSQPKLHIDMPIREFDSSGPAEHAHTDTERLPSGARKISHSRSATEASFFENQNGNSSAVSLAPSDDSDEDFDGGKPALLRKKSGELVKPAIRPSSRHRSMPGTPTYSKAVHFCEDIQQVKHFLQVDRPIAVSAGTSPVDGRDDESEFPFGSKASAGVEWELRLTNFPRDTFERMSKPIRTERLYLTPDQKNMVGVVAVANLSFHKHVTARFTLDHWRTTSEVIAEYNNDPLQKPRKDGYDQFNFSIKLSDQANLEGRTLLMCMRYSVNGQEFWDNNDNMNYSVEFVKRSKPAEVKSSPVAASIGSRPIPRSRHNSAVSTSRPRSMPSFEDDFSSGFETDTSIKFRSGQGRGFGQPPRVTSGGSQFSTRYDFGASLTAALSQAQRQLSEPSEQRSQVGAQANGTSSIQPPPSSSIPARTGVAAPASSHTETPRTATLFANKQDMDSRAYQEFVNKFCFFGSKEPPSQDQKQATPPTSKGNDGAQDDQNTKPGIRNGSHASTEPSTWDPSSPPHTISPACSGAVSPTPTPIMNNDRFPFNVGYQSGMLTPTAIQG